MLIRRRQLLFGAVAGATTPLKAAAGPRLQVGPQRALRTLAEAAALAPPGSTVEVDAGSYLGDVAVWTRDDVSVRAVGGRVVLRAGGQAAEDKAIWVVRAQGMRIEGFDFEGTRVAARNGAGIRFERGSLVVRDCRFIGNEMGLLTGNDPQSELEVHDCEFAHNRRDDGGHDHNLYAGTIARLRVVGSYFHHASVGHLLKSRAARSEILYSRLADEGGNASYELEFPNGGSALVLGNVLQQSARTENPVMLSYGAEGLRWAVNELVIANNTFIDELPSGGVFFRTLPLAGRVVAVNNAWVGNGRLPSLAEAGGNVALNRSDLDAQYHPHRPLPGVAVAAEWTPRRQFRSPRGSVALAPSTAPYAGAYAPSP